MSIAYNKLVNYLSNIESRDFNHPLLGVCMEQLASLSPEDRMSVMQVSFGSRISFKSLIQKILEKFKILSFYDETGPKSILTFNETVNVAWWDSLEAPISEKKVNIYDNTYRGTEMWLCKGQIEFVRFLMTTYSWNFKEFTRRVRNR